MKLRLVSAQLKAINSTETAREQIRGLKIRSRANAADISPMIERRACVLTKVFN
jgi:hypothetical protein